MPSHTASSGQRRFSHRQLVEELFQEGESREPRLSIRDYLRQTRATPLSGLTKALLLAAFFVVLALLLAVIVIG